MGLVGEVGDLEAHPASNPVTATASNAAMRRRPLMTAIMSAPLSDVLPAWSSKMERPSLTLSGDATIEVVPYNSAWPGLFERERRELLDTIGPWLAGPIEHIGSTAIPGLSAKPVIDIMAGVASLDASRPAVAPLAALDYCSFPYRPEDEHWFCKPSPSFRTHHLHLVPLASPQWAGALAFRDYLRARPETAAEYETLKKRLALEFRLDREAYTEAKGPFITRITALALG